VCSSDLAIEEGADLHLFDRWCYLGTAANEAEVAELLSEKRPEFDLDIYKIIRKALKGIAKERVIPLRA
jgi:DNA polymerase-3 subunit epsilon